MAHGLKSLVIADDIQSDPALDRNVERATKLLIEELEDSAGLVDASWRCDSDDHGRRIVELQIVDSTGSAVDRFAPDELENVDHMARRLYRLWGRLLREGLDRQLERLHQVVQELEG